MHEQLKPCPACDESGFTVFIQELNGEWQGHCGCGHATRYYKTREAAIAAWNSLPRRPDYNDVDCAGCPERRRGYLTWTTEPPKVPGWYWFSVCKEHAVCILVCADGKAKLAKDYFTDAELLGGEWAGPIPAPLEPEES